MGEKVVSFYDSENGRPIPSLFEKMRYSMDILFCLIGIQIGNTDHH